MREQHKHTGKQEILRHRLSHTTTEETHMADSVEHTQNKTLTGETRSNNMRGICKPTEFTYCIF